MKLDDDFIKKHLLCYNSNNGVYQLKSGIQRKIINDPKYFDIKNIWIIDILMLMIMVMLHIKR